MQDYKTGGLPNITYVSFKSKPLGTEFNCCVDRITKVMLYLEVQEGKVRMSKNLYFTKLVLTASCVMRSVDAGNYFIVFPDIRKFIPHLHGEDPRLKDPSLEQKNIVLSSDLSTEATGLTPLQQECPPPPFTQYIDEVEDKKVSPCVVCHKL